MSNSGGGSGDSARAARLEQLRANAREMTQQKQPSRQPAPKLNLNTPAPTKSIQNQQMLDSAAAQRNAYAQKQAQDAPKSPERSAKTAFAKAAAKRPTEPFNRAAGIDKNRPR